MVQHWGQMTHWSFKQFLIAQTVIHTCNVPNEWGKNPQRPSAHKTPFQMLKISQPCLHVFCSVIVSCFSITPNFPIISTQVGLFNQSGSGASKDFTFWSTAVEKASMWSQKNWCKASLKTVLGPDARTGYVWGKRRTYFTNQKTVIAIVVLHHVYVEPEKNKLTAMN